MDEMEDKTSVPSDESDVEVDLRRSSKIQPENRRTSRWRNGQCVLAVPTSSMLSPRFDLSLCRALLERDGFQIPVADFETPLDIALDVPSVRRYLYLNSSLFHFIMAPILYVVIWCAVFSTLHLYLSVTDYWVLGLSVSLVSIFLTTVIIVILHYSNKEINMNIDVRLIQVNERLSRHKLLVGVADWVQNCTGSLQLFIVYWDAACCLRTLTETLEEMSFVRDEAQKRLNKRMSHLVLVTEVMTFDPVAGGSSVNEGSDEERPLLVNDEETGRSTSTSQREDTKLTTNYSLVPDQILPAQAKALQLLLTYGAVYVKLLLSEKLPNSTHRPLRSRRNHCTTASVCLCQYIKTKVLRL
ncbi:transmembrane protein 268-like [Coregonus clupeaformis]|uniref:Transmembrane protein 268 n=1 Tax=Coregonus suidteri TaxID=861788 RepID=A0AAN8R4P6_9TELE|nr:transmembrane protein 268-like [Coregonus clupeaformis]XP_041738863.1 transmembrane protein 268-like [Coregonus clupeaformis]XP_041738865.1 transmembrane protein 268-like [Coregonus clupeaformis]XP_041738866.1 transmembrane protein 268-like [Coregonus clupeaformis]XP_041738867.1 transmembrane protein 268-like [Coregonus clupeaformis]